MAIDEALLRRAQRTGETVYRLYSWSPPTVSLGRNQTARGRYDLGLARARGVHFVRRPTGGRAILHHREITYSVAAPVAAFGTLGESYRAINRLLVEALRLHGVAAREAEAPERTPIPGTTPCFEAPAAGELVAGSGTGARKLVGSAQIREGDAFLQHGSILVDDDQQLLANLATRGPSTPPATLRELTGREVTVHEFAAGLAAALTALGAAPLALTLDASLIQDVDLLIRTRYAVADWTWRR
jgi:lipoyl(octanoyl) transferase